MKTYNCLGCFSSSAIITALVTLAVIAGTALARGNGMFSPGALNASEGRSMGGVSSHAATLGDCELCHVAPWSKEYMADRCEDCHSDVASDMTKIAKAHGEMQHGNPSLNCAHCHPEHRGPSALLTLASARAEYPHDLMDYSLNGHQLTAKNQPFVCEDCHAQSLTGFNSSTCIDCHQNIDPAFTQVHVLSWGEDCLACHDGVDTYNKHFDHGKVPFELTGAHVDVDCYTCHVNARSLVDLQFTPRDCFSCHREDEPHENRFGADCAECHAMEAWTPSTFDHNLTAFTLEGSHIEVSCEDCHTTTIPTETPQDCFACHSKDDEHAGAFGTQCGACHKTTAWNDFPFDHDDSRFPLTGRHIGLACEQCHKDGQFAGTTDTCVGCHGYPGWHGSFFGANCLDCHTTSSWYQAQIGAHPWFSHPREEGISMRNCRSCHPVSVFDSDCSSCHENGMEEDDG